MDIKEESFTSEDEFHSKDDVDFASEELQGQSCGSGIGTLNSLNGFHHNSTMFEDNANVIYIKEDVDEYQIKQEEFHEDTEDVFEEHHDKMDYEIKIVDPQKTLTDVRGLVDVHPMVMISVNSSNKYNKDKGNKEGGDVPMETSPIEASTSQGENQSIKKFRCSLCGYETNQKGHLNAHLLTHSNTKLFKCTECDYECIQKSNLKKHLLTHSNVKLFKCTECDYEGNRKDHLKQHLLTHSNMKLFKCTECDYEGNRRDHLKQHLLTHSNSTKFFKCSECDYECFQKSHLKRHSLIHSNTKLFKCAECKYESKWKEGLKRHLLTHLKKKNIETSIGNIDVRT